MAGLRDVGHFDCWLTDRLMLTVVHGRTGSTGQFEHWLADRQWLQVYVRRLVVPWAFLFGGMVA